MSEIYIKEGGGVQREIRKLYDCMWNEGVFIEISRLILVKQTRYQISMLRSHHMQNTLSKNCVTKPK